MTKKNVNNRANSSGAATNKPQVVNSNNDNPTNPTGTATNKQQAVQGIRAGSDNDNPTNPTGATTGENPQGGGKRILRQKGGVYPPKDKMSDAALMIRSFFTTLRAPAMSLFIRDPNAATLEDVETKSPVYTGIGIGFWACLATISGQIISSSIAQVC